MSKKIFLHNQILTYMGNKRKFLDKIEQIIEGIKKELKKIILKLKGHMCVTISQYPQSRTFKDVTTQHFYQKILNNAEIYIHKISITLKFLHL